MQLVARPRLPNEAAKARGIRVARGPLRQARSQHRQQQLLRIRHAFERVERLSPLAPRGAGSGFRMQERRKETGCHLLAGWAFRRWSRIIFAART